jgi:hypothetical protein
MKKKFLLIIIIFVLLLTGCKDTCSMDLLETINSPDEKYSIKTYKRNCGATVDFGIVGMLCNNKNKKCKKIYYSYHEYNSFVYWIDNKNVFINNKELNIYKDKYKNYDYDNAFRLEKTIDYSRKIYLIDRNNNEHQISGFDADYIYNKSTSIFDFKNTKTDFDKYDFILRIIELKTDKKIDYYLTIDNNKMYLKNENQVSIFNRSDYEYMKKVLIENNLYTF